MQASTLNSTMAFAYVIQSCELKDREDAIEGSWSHLTIFCPGIGQSLLKIKENTSLPDVEALFSRQSDSAK